MKIEKLTKEQESKLDEYRDKWIAIGLATQKKPINKEVVSEIIGRVYKNGGLPPPERVVFCQSPIDIKKKYSDMCDDELKNYSGDCIYGQHDANWLAFYEFFRLECGLVEETDIIVPSIELAYHTNWCLPFDKICFVSEKPITCRMKNGRLHSDEGPAIEYADGFSVYALNGVRINDIKHLLSKDTKPKDILKIKNVEQRAEFIKWYGVEKMFKDLKPKRLDREKGYELYQLKIYEDSPRIYLKMDNPSVDEVHLEAVHPDCKTVQQALQWRNFGTIEIPKGGFEQPYILT